MAETTSLLPFLNTLSTLPLIHSLDTTPQPSSLPPSAYILPRMPKPYTPHAPSTSTSTPTRITVTIKPLKPIPTIPTGSSVDLEVSADTSVYEVKRELARRTGYSVEKVKVLQSKRPVGDAKTVGEVLGVGAGSGGEVGRKSVLEFSAMFTGAPTERVEDTGHGATGGAGVQTADAASLEAARGEDVGKAGGVEGRRDVEMTQEDDGKPAAIGKSGREVLETEEFWEDLRGFVLQRTRDEGVADTFVGEGRKWWRSAS